MTQTRTAEAAAYLVAVERELVDLPAEERAELLEDLGLHLQSVEEESDDRSLEARLGSAQTYAAELRTAAGLPPRGRLKTPVEASVAQAVIWVAQRRALRDFRDFLQQLRPGWWVLRGYLVIVVLCIGQHGIGVIGDTEQFRISSSKHDFPLPAPFGSHVLGVVVVLAAMFASVRISRSRLKPPLGAVVVAANIVLITIVICLAGAARTQ